MDKLIERLSELTDNRFSGTVTLSFYKGSLSKKIKLEVTENLKLVDSLIAVTGSTQTRSPKP